MPATAQTSDVHEVHTQCRGTRRAGTPARRAKSRAAPTTRCRRSVAATMTAELPKCSAWRAGTLAASAQRSAAHAAHDQRDTTQQQAGADDRRQERRRRASAPARAETRAPTTAPPAPAARAPIPTLRSICRTTAAGRRRRYFAMPTAVITAFMSASALAMNLANSSASPAHDAEAALGHEVLVFLAVVGLLHRGFELRRDVFAGKPFGAAMPRHAPVAQSLPMASFKRRHVGEQRGPACRPSPPATSTLPASISERASGSEHGTNSTPPATRSCSPGAAPLRRHPRHGRRVDLRVAQHARERQVPDATLAGARWP